jgi:hypothetical protein
MLIFKSVDEDNQKSFWRPNGAKQAISSFLLHTVSMIQHQEIKRDHGAGKNQEGHSKPGIFIPSSSWCKARENGR